MYFVFGLENNFIVLAVRMSVHIMHLYQSSYSKHLLGPPETIPLMLIVLNLGQQSFHTVFVVVVVNCTIFCLNIIPHLS